MKNKDKSYAYIIDNPPKSLVRSYELAKQMIPILISWAQEKRSPQYYGTLSNVIGHSTARIGKQLGVIGDIFKRLHDESGEDVPLLNALVINKESKRPSDGLGDVIDGYDQLDEEEQVNEAKRRNNLAYAYKNWPWVLNALGLMPYTSSSDDAIRKGKCRKSDSEGSYHKSLKEYILNHPNEFGINDVKNKENEHVLLSGDRLDVYFHLNDGKQIAIEVKSRISDDADILRGIYQCVKYKAVLAAECLAHGQNAKVDAFLVTETELSKDNRKTANMLSVKYFVFNGLK